MDTFIQKFMGRNYHLAMLIVILSYTLCLWGHMTGAEFATLAGGIFSGFRAGDAIVNWIHARRATDDSPNSEPCPAPPCSPPTGNRDTNDRPG